MKYSHILFSLSVILGSVVSINIVISNNGTNDKPVWVISTGNRLKHTEILGNTKIYSSFKGSKRIAGITDFDIPGGHNLLINSLGREAICSDSLNIFICLIVDTLGLDFSIKTFVFVIVSCYLSYKIFPVLFHVIYSLYTYYKIGRYQGIYYKRISTVLQDVISYFSEHKIPIKLVDILENETKSHNGFKNLDDVVVDFSDA